MGKEICSGCEEISASGSRERQTGSAAAVQGREGQVLLRGVRGSLMGFEPGLEEKLDSDRQRETARYN